MWVFPISWLCAGYSEFNFPLGLGNHAWTWAVQALNSTPHAKFTLVMTASAFYLGLRIPYHQADQAGGQFTIFVGAGGFVVHSPFAWKPSLSWSGTCAPAGPPGNGVWSCLLDPPWILNAGSRFEYLIPWLPLEQ